MGHPLGWDWPKWTSSASNSQDWCWGREMMKHNWLAASATVMIMSAMLFGAQSAGAQSAKQNAGQSVAASGGESSASVGVEPEATGEPHTEMLDPSREAAGDPLLDRKPLPRAELALIGGIVRKVDLVRNRITLQPFGGGEKYVVYFDERSRILSAGRETTVLAIHPGDRLYADTQALGAEVFARTLQVRPVVGPAQASGQVMQVAGGQVRLLDRLSGASVRFQITDRTKVEERGKASSASELHPGSLIDVTFTAGGRREAQSIEIHATPGESYLFTGILTFVDLRDGVLAVDNQVDGSNYELSFDPQMQRDIPRLVVGTPVAVTASFDGKKYRAMSIRVTQARQP